MSLFRVVKGFLLIGGIPLVVCSSLVAQTISATIYPLSADPVGIASGPDGALWFTELAANRIGRITTSGSLTEYPVPWNTGGASVPPGA